MFAGAMNTCQGLECVNLQHSIFYPPCDYFKPQLRSPNHPLERFACRLQKRDVTVRPILAGPAVALDAPRSSGDFCPARSKILAGKKGHRRTGMDLWQILVAGASVRLRCEDADWDRMRRSGQPPPAHPPDARPCRLPVGPMESKSFGHQTLRDNVAACSDDELLCNQSGELPPQDRRGVR